jgi:YidC/Oxa1 family membrane protein insertase
MLPLTFTQQKSSKRMQALSPEVDKIKKKYEGLTDKDSQNKMNQEIQTIYAREKINPFAGCLPLLIQLPIFYALYNVMQYPYRYIDSIKTLYVDKLAGTLIKIFRADSSTFNSFIPFARAHFSAKDNFSFTTAEQLAKLLNKLSEKEWVEYIAAIPQKFGAEIANLNSYLAEKKAVETFIGLNLVESAGLTFPKILIPIISGLTSFLSQYLLMKQTSPSGSGKDAMASTQKNMLIFMPLFMAFITINTPIGVGLYWIAGNIVILIQQPIIELLFSKKENRDK